MPVDHIEADEEWGLDHGAYVPLMVMYPDGDVPVLQMSIPTHDPVKLFELGEQLQSLRDEGVLIVGSGLSYHNLRRFGEAGLEQGEQPVAELRVQAVAGFAVNAHDLLRLRDDAGLEVGAALAEAGDVEL